MNGPSFLSPAERDEFERPGRLIARTAVESFAAGVPCTPPRTCNLIASLSERLTSITAREGTWRWFEAACVQVRRDDGMTWSAEATRRALAEAAPSFKVHLLGDALRVDTLPALVSAAHGESLLKQSVLIRLAARHRLIRTSLGRWPIAVGLALVLTSGLFEVARLALRSRLSAPSLPADSRLLIVSVVLFGVLALLGKYLDRLANRDSSKTVEQLVAALHAAHDSRAYDDLVDHLARRLASGAFPRCVVVDGFEKLDPTTRAVVRRYFEEHSSHAAGSEYWVVFEGEDGERLSTRVLDEAEPSRQRFGYSLTRVLDQNLLSERERQQLADAVGRPDRAVFTTAKGIAATADGNWAERLFREWRAARPSGAASGSLELIYLLALSTERGSTSVTYRFLMRRFAGASQHCRRLLAQLLPDANLTRRDVEARLREMEHELGSVIVATGQGATRAIEIKREAGAWLAAHGSELGLPDRATVSLFWVLLWHDWLARRVDAFWARELSGHLQRLSLQLLDHDLAEQVMDICLFTIEALLDTCVFQDVTALIDLGLALADAWPQEAGWRRRLLHLSWEGYCLLGDERLLTPILDARLPRSIAASNPHPLDDLFVASLPLSFHLRQGISLGAINAALGGRERISAVDDHARVRGGYLSAVISPLLFAVSVSRNSSLAAAAATLDESLRSLLAQAPGKVRSGSGGAAQLVDLGTLSLGLWTSGAALRLRPREWAHRHGPLEAEDDADTDTSGHGPKEFVAEILAEGLALEALVAAATTAVTLAQDIRREEVVSRHRREFVARAFAREICVVALATLVMTRRELSAVVRSMLPELDQRIAAVTSSVEGVFSLPPDDVKQLDGSALSTTIDKLFALCVLVWDRLGLARQRDLLTLRRMECYSVLAGVNPAGYSHFDPLVASLSAALAEQSYTGLVANLVLANCYNDVAELKAHYVQAAAGVTKGGNLADGLVQELALIAIMHDPASPEVGALLELLLRPTDGGTDDSALWRLLEGIEPGDIVGVVLRLFNAAKSTGLPAVQQTLRATAERLAAALSDVAARDALRSLLEFFDVRTLLEGGGVVDADGVLRRWADRRESWTYAGLLCALIDHGAASPAVRAETVSRLDHSADLDHFNAWFLLAISLASRVRLRDPHEIGVVRSYVARALERWRSQSAIETNVAALRVLVDLDPAHGPQWMGELQDWLVTKVRRDHLRQVPMLAAKGHYYLIFREYAGSMQFWGLRSDLPERDLQTRLQIPTADRIGFVRAWQADGQCVPTPIVGQPARLSAEFLCLGEYLFLPPLGSNPEFTDARRRFDAAAERALPKLVDAIVALPALPAAVRELLDSYGRRFTDHAVPAE